MKILETLSSLIPRLDQKEVTYFRKYLGKKRKKVLLLFEGLLKFNDKTESPIFSNYLKRNKIDSNLRYLCNELYDPIINFWSENTNEDETKIKLSKRLHAASILIKKGMFEDGIQEFKKVEKIASEMHYYYLAIEANKWIAVYSQALNTKSTEKIFSNFQTSQDSYLLDVADQNRTLFLVVTAYQMINNGIWTLTDDQKIKLKNIYLEAKQTLERENLNSCSYTILTSNLSQYLAIGSLEESEKDALKSIELLESTQANSKNLSITVNLLVAYSNYCQRLFMEGRMVEGSAIVQKIIEVYNLWQDPTSQMDYIFHSTQFMRCIYKNEFEYGVKSLMPSSLEIVNSKNIQFIDYFSINIYCFEIYFALGDYEKATEFSNNLNGNNSKKTTDCQLVSRLIDLLLNFELGNQLFVKNQAESTRRLYSSFLPHNPAGKLLLKLLIKLGVAPNNKLDRIPIYQSFSDQFEEILSNYQNQHIFMLDIIPAWLSSKIDGYDTIIEAVNANQKI